MARCRSGNDTCAWPSRHALSTTTSSATIGDWATGSSPPTPSRCSRVDDGKCRKRLGGILSFYCREAA